MSKHINSQLYAENGLYTTEIRPMSGSSLSFVGSTNIVSGTFAVYTGSNDQPAMQVRDDGLFMIGIHRLIPTAQTGGFYTDGSDWFVAII